MENQKPAEAKGSSIDLLGSMKKGLSSVALSGAKWAIGKGLNAAFGWEKPETKRRNWAKETLTSIQAEISVIARDVNAINVQLNQLTLDFEDNVYIGIYNDLQRDFQKTSKYVGTAYKDFTVLMENLENLTTEKREKLLSDVLKMEILIDGEITGMQNLLFSGSDFSHGRTIMDAWTDACIVQYKNGKGDILDWYSSMENKLREFLTPLFIGYVLKINILNHQKDLVNDIDQDGIDYFNTFFRESVIGILKNFKECVERLVISTYRPDINPSENNQPKIQMISDQKINTIFTRADLASWLITSFDVETVHPGIYYRSLTRPSQVESGSNPKLFNTEKDAGKALQPNENYESSKGVVVKINPAYNSSTQHLEYWYKCLDVASGSTSSDVVRIRSFKDSYIRTVRYHWDVDDKNPVPGQALNTSGEFKAKALSYYSKLTLNPIDPDRVVTDEETGEPINAVMMMSYSEANKLRENVLMNYLTTQADHGWKFDTSGMKENEIPGGHQLASLEKSSRFKDKLPYYGEVKVKLYPKNHSSKHERTAEVVLNMEYDSADGPVDAHLIMDSDYTARINPLEDPHKEWASIAHWDTKYFVEYPKEHYHNNQVSRPGTEENLLGHKVHDASHVKYKSADGDQLTCIPNARLRLRWYLRIHIQEGREQFNDNAGRAVERECRAKWNIENFRLAWKYPDMKAT